ncbi:MAG TPA: GyrI-like domain-containing protein [Burkholderiaceae bacterium]|nr:GyrI-like domain-containing protein [Burkholderiaceae bacterium]
MPIWRSRSTFRASPRAPTFRRGTFHRLFQALTGEMLAERVRRQRLEAAALRLLGTPPAPALSIALEVGFASAEVFTRAFKAHFGVTPGAWRRGAYREWAERRRLQLHEIHRNAHAAKQALDDLFPAHADAQHRERAPSGAALDVTLRNLPDVRVAYLRHIGPYGDPAIARMWQRFIAWNTQTGLLGRREQFGVSHDSPDVTAPEKCRYDACVAVDADFQPHGELGVQNLKGGLYACVSFRGTACARGSTDCAWRRKLCCASASRRAASAHWSCRG